MRLTSTQLRTIIAEEVARIRGRRLSEGAGAGIDMSAVVDEAEAAFYGDASAAFDEDDPSMAALGEDAWNAQVDEAAMDFRNKVDAALKSTVDNAMNSVMSKLLDGEYA